MLINQGTIVQTLGQFPELTSVQWVFPDPFPRASDITLPLGKVSLPLLGRLGNQFGSAFLLPLQLSDGVWGVGGLKSATRESQAFTDKFELGREHVLLLEELTEGVMVLMVARDIGDEAKFVGGDDGVAELLEVRGLPNEHLVEPGG